MCSNCKFGILIHCAASVPSALSASSCSWTLLGSTHECTATAQSVKNVYFTHILYVFGFGCLVLGDCDPCNQDEGSVVTLSPANETQELNVGAWIKSAGHLMCHVGREVRAVADCAFQHLNHGS